MEKRNNHDYDMYFVLDMPAASDRDLVINITTSWDYKEGQCKVVIKNQETTNVSESKIVSTPPMPRR